MSCSRSATSRRAILRARRRPLARGSVALRARSLASGRARRPRHRARAAHRHGPDDGRCRRPAAGIAPGQPHHRALARRAAAARPSRRRRPAEGQGLPVPEGSESLLELLRFVRSAAVAAELGGGDWRDAVNAPCARSLPICGQGCRGTSSGASSTASLASGTSTATASRRRWPRRWTRSGAPARSRR